MALSNVAASAWEVRAMNQLSFGKPQNDHKGCAQYMTMAERELTAFFGAVTELFGPEQAALSAGEWLRELEGVSTRAIAAVIGKHLNVPVVSKGREEATEHFGWMGLFFAMDGPSSSTQTQKGLGWKPTHAGLITDLDDMRYFESEQPAVLHR